MIKEYLENKFNIRFDVKRIADGYSIIPHNEDDNLFFINAYIRSGVRLVIEIKPQSHAKGMLQDMSEASDDKICLFNQYVEQLLVKDAKIDARVNGFNLDINNWPRKWNSMEIRITKIVENQDKASELMRGIELSICLVLSLLEVSDPSLSFEEGGKKSTTIDRYERNPVNRELCILHNGYVCKVCGEKLDKKYGDIGENYIEVHHILPISSFDSKHMVNPIRDMITVCPNCHRMMHRRVPPYTPDEIKTVLAENKYETSYKQ